jgi:NADP-dependent 3-hydroxy acid dehydrogenase YdfG
LGNLSTCGAANGAANIYGLNRYTALGWARRHNFKASKTDIKTHTIRIRQHAPGLYKKGSFRTITLKPEIKAVIGKRKKSSHKKTR